MLRFYASSGDATRRDLEVELGVPDAMQYALHTEVGKVLKAIGFALGSRLVAAGVVPVEPKLMRHMFHGGSDENEDEGEEEEAGNRTVRKKAIMDDFHEAFVGRVRDLSREKVEEEFGAEVLREVDTALALLNLAGRWREKFSLVRGRGRPRSLRIAHARARANTHTHTHTHSRPPPPFPPQFAQVYESSRGKAPAAMRVVL